MSNDRTYTQMKNASSSILLETAKDVVSQVIGDSRIIDDENVNRLDQVASNEISVGRAIGRGGFCTVKEVTIKPRRTKRRNSHPGQIPELESTGGSSASAFREEIRGASSPRVSIFRGKRNKDVLPRLVLKQVSEESMHENRIMFLKATIGLALEVQFLSALSHPNIIEPRSVSELGPFSLGYFFIMDRLQCTLPVKMKRWTTIDRQCKGITGIFTGGEKKVRRLLVDRLVAAHSIASALCYIHSHNLIYRDLKPDNIGFDLQGNVKLFDFGLTRELHDGIKTKNGFYKLTSFTGSIRYMAPEVGLKLPYNQSADVYSFSLLLWYIMTLQPPYGFYTPEMITIRVFQEGERPVTMIKWPFELSAMIESAWSSKTSKRPDFKEIIGVIRRVLINVDEKEAKRLGYC